MHIEGYDHLERIGDGGLGDVYRAVRRSTGGVVAIKVLRDVSDESVAWHRTRRELTALVALAGHAHVVQLIELLDLPEGPALVMEYAPGGSVAELLARRGGQLTVPEAVLIGRHTAAALVAAHAQHIVHRDLKPQNLLIDAYGQVKLCDFGIASLARSEEFRTRTNALSMRYASPEDLDEETEVGPASDVYSLGATLLHLRHGAPPTLKERLQPWTPPATGDAEAAALDSVIASCLQPDPAQRPPAAGVLDRLESIDWTLAERCRALPVVEPTVGELTPRAEVGTEWPSDDDSDEEFGDDTSAPTAPRADAVVAPLPTRPAPDRRRRWPWVVGAVVVAGLAGAAVALYWPDSDEPDRPSTETTLVEATSTTLPTTTTAPASGTEGVDVVERPTGLDALDAEATTWPFGPVGECLVQVNGLEELMPVDCGEPHDLQRFHVGEVTGAEFSAAAVDTETDTACRLAFAEFVGVADDESQFQIAVTRPTAASWSEGDRAFQCLLGVPGHHIAGDAEASAR